VILQLDFDGTLTHGDVNEGLFQRFAGEAWSARIEAASKELLRDPSSPALIETLKDASAYLAATDEECLAFAVAHNAPREGLASLIETAERLAMECHVVSYGFDFYIRHYLRLAGVESRVSIHSGETSGSATGRLLRYTGPSGEDITSDWKRVWTREFRHRDSVLVYAGDGSSDIAPAMRCDVVFARDSLLRGLPRSFAGTLLPFETLHDIARGLQELYG
jgi:2-hydroxy-3-keto-5-methylthiopentenyl-1-phosphate phosphatase